MAGAYAIVVEGFQAALRGLAEIPDNMKLAMVRAVNETVEHARAVGAKKIRQQINLPASYLSGPSSRLAITKKATRSDIEGVITGRHRPTSLARFTSAGAAGTRKGVSVQVKPGFARFMRRAFLIRLRAGNELTDTRFNLGLALRLKPGERIQNKREMVQIDSNLYLLYGPSVDQVFSDVAGEISPAIEDYLESEFLRLMDVT